MKKKFAVIFAAMMALSAVPAYAAVSAAPTASKVLVNGTAKAFEAYNIQDNNYFKLRDIAYVLNDTDAAFSVGWNAAANAVALDTSGKYAPTGNEMKVSGSTAKKNAVESNSAILVNGAKAALKAYNIDGNNYFKLRDLGTALGFDVGWDNASQTISITAGAAAAATPTTKPETDTKADPLSKTVLTKEELKELGVNIEVISIYYSRGTGDPFFIESVTFSDDCPFVFVSANKVNVCGADAYTYVYTREDVMKSWEADRVDPDYFLQYNFPNGVMVMNNEPGFPDYGKKNDISIEYQLKTKDGKTYTCKTDYNLLVEGNGGPWIE